eukprot:2444923-Pyramimonas_sp.AAC.2
MELTKRDITRAPTGMLVSSRYCWRVFCMVKSRVCSVCVSTTIAEKCALSTTASTTSTASWCTCLAQYSPVTCWNRNYVLGFRMLQSQSWECALNTKGGSAWDWRPEH